MENAGAVSLVSATRLTDDEGSGDEGLLTPAKQLYRTLDLRYSSSGRRLTANAIYES